MSGSRFGQIFTVVNWGESHGPAVGAVVDGCPAGVRLEPQVIQNAMNRRRPGQSHLVSQRQESDRVEILSGVLNGLTTGTPISLLIKNENPRSQDYANLAELYRPSHADYTYDKKYGIRDVAGGGRSSARITAGWVAAGEIARALLAQAHGVEILAWVSQVGPIQATVDAATVCAAEIEASPTRCPDAVLAGKIETLILATRKQGDSVGGRIDAVIRNLPLGLGEPVADKFEADLAKAMLSINASKGFEFGSGFAGCAMKGSQHNDLFICENEQITTQGNNSGGVQGGISNGMPVNFSVAFKPTATLLQPQRTIDRQGKSVSFQVHGRHDPCILPRAVPIVEAMAAMVAADHLLRSRVARL